LLFAVSAKIVLESHEGQPIIPTKRLGELPGCSFRDLTLSPQLIWSFAFTLTFLIFGSVYPGERVNSVHNMDRAELNPALSCKPDESPLFKMQAILQ